MWRLTLAVAAGFITMSVLLVCTQLLMLRFLFHSSPADAIVLPPAYLLANGVMGLCFAVVGGCLTAAIGKKYEAPTILGALLLGMAIGGVVMNRGGQPLWYVATVPLVEAIVATVAGYRWLGREPLDTGRRPAR